jgi:hypothetical protein
MILNFSAKAGCLSFAYNMFGRHVNKLTLYAEGTNTVKASLWSKQGNQGADWLIDRVNIPATEGLKVQNCFFCKTIKSFWLIHLCFICFANSTYMY